MPGELDLIKRLTFEAVKSQTQRERDTFGPNSGLIWAARRTESGRVEIHIWNYLGIAQA